MNFSSHLSSSTGQVKTVDYKGVGVRGIAVIVDQVLIALIVFPVMGIIGIYERDVSLAIAGIVYLFYHVALEFRYGQTIGKRLFGIKVAMVDGQPCSLKAAIMRNVGRILDVALGGYILGIIFIVFSPKRQRIGDYLAGTVVVKK